MEGPFNKGFFTADIDGIVHENNWTSLVLIKVALEVILESFQILVPLSREKLQNLTLDVSREILLQVSDTCKAFVESFVAYYASEGDMITSGHFYLF